MKRTLLFIITCICVIVNFSFDRPSCAVEKNSNIPQNYTESSTQIIKASGSFNIRIDAHNKTITGTILHLSAGDTVQICANYSPSNSRIDFGLLDSSGAFHYISTTTGKIDKIIRVPELGNYRLAIKNNSSTAVRISGFVHY